MNVEFLTQLVVNEIDDDNWMLHEDFKALVTNGEPRIITVPVGFRTDFASVPRIPFVFDKFGNKAHRPAVLHDFLYSQGGTEDDRQFADHVFLAAMLADGMDSPTAHEMYDGVRAFGASHFGTN